MQVHSKRTEVRGRVQQYSYSETLSSVLVDMQHQTLLGCQRLKANLSENSKPLQPPNWTARK